MPSRAEPPHCVKSEWIHCLLENMTLQQLRELELQARQQALTPLPDELAWKDTEIDVRRVVL